MGIAYEGEKGERGQKGDRGPVGSPAILPFETPKGVVVGPVGDKGDKGERVSV